MHSMHSGKSLRLQATSSVLDELVLVDSEEVESDPPELSDVSVDSVPDDSLDFEDEDFEPPSL